MTPTVQEVLQGCVIAIATPPSGDAGADYATSRFGMVSMLMMLAAQEADRAAAATIGENADIRAVLGGASAYDRALGGRLTKATAATDADLSVSALDAANAELRRLLIELHQLVETAGDAAADRTILELYGRMARGRRMALQAG